MCWSPPAKAVPARASGRQDRRGLRGVSCVARCPNRRRRYPRAFPSPRKPLAHCPPPDRDRKGGPMPRNTSSPDSACRRPQPRTPPEPPNRNATRRAHRGGSKNRFRAAPPPAAPGALATSSPPARLGAWRDKRRQFRTACPRPRDGPERAVRMRRERGRAPRSETAPRQTCSKTRRPARCLTAAPGERRLQRGRRSATATGHRAAPDCVRWAASGARVPTTPERQARLPSFRRAAQRAETRVRQSPACPTVPPVRRRQIAAGRFRDRGARPVPDTPAPSVRCHGPGAVPRRARTVRWRPDLALAYAAEAHNAPCARRVAARP